MTRLAVDVPQLRHTGMVLTHCGTDLGGEVGALALALSRVGTAAGHVGVATAAAVAEDRWGTALIELAAATTAMGVAVTAGAQAYQHAETAAARRFGGG